MPASPWMYPVQQESLSSSVKEFVHVNPEIHLLEQIPNPGRYDVYRGECHARGPSEGIEVLVKAAKDPHQSGLIANELAWHRHFQEGIGAVASPRVIASTDGVIAVEYLRDGTWIAEEPAGNPSTLARIPETIIIETLADAFHTIRRTTLPLPNDSASGLPYSGIDGSEIGIRHAMTRFAAHYMNGVSIDCDRLLSIIQESPMPPLGLNHTDPMPWHIFLRGGRVHMIDAEFATNLAPAHYDVCSAAAVFHTHLRDSGLARRLLNAYRSMIPARERDGFIATARPLLALRAIAQLHYGARDKDDLTPYLLLKREIEQRTIP